MPWAVSCVGSEWALGLGGRDTDRESFLISYCGCPCPNTEDPSIEQKSEKPEAGDRREEKAPWYAVGTGS